MTSYRSLNHTKWACQYHVVFIPTYREEGDLRGFASVARGGVAPLGAALFGVKYFCRSTSTILAGSDGCSFDDAPFAGRCCGF